MALDVCEVAVCDRYTCNIENRALDVRSRSIYADRANLCCDASSQLRPAAGAVIYGQLFASPQLQGIAYIATSPRLFSKFPADASSLAAYLPFAPVTPDSFSKIKCRHDALIVVQMCRS